MQLNAKNIKKQIVFSFQKISKIIMQINANLSKFEQSKHIAANDANRSYSKTIHPNLKKMHKNLDLVELSNQILIYPKRQERLTQTTNNNTKHTMFPRTDQ